MAKLVCVYLSDCWQSILSAMNSMLTIRLTILKALFGLIFTAILTLYVVGFALIKTPATYGTIHGTIVRNQTEGVRRNIEEVDLTLGDKWSTLTAYRILNSNICPWNLTFVVVVHSAVKNFNKRLGIRQTWANPAHYKGFTMKTVFFLGSTNDSTLQFMVEEENDHFQDIVQGHFLDTYRNLTYKGVMVFKWVTEFCSQVELVIKVDDDVFVNMFKVLYTHLPLMQRKPRQLLCEVEFAPQVNRTKSYKWGLASNELPGRRFYPRYCRGYFVLIRPILLKVLLKNVFLYPFFWIDDIYLFGILTEFSKVTFIDDKDFLAESTESCILSFSPDEKREPADRCLNIKDAKEMVRIWTSALRKNGGKYLETIVSNYSLKSWISEYES